MYFNDERLTIDESAQVLHCPDIIVGRSTCRADLVQNFLAKASQDVEDVREDVNGLRRTSSGLSREVEGVSRAAASLERKVEDLAREMEHLSRDVVRGDEGQRGDGQFRRRGLAEHRLLARAVRELYQCTKSPISSHPT